MFGLGVRLVVVVLAGLLRRLALPAAVVALLAFVTLIAVVVALRVRLLRERAEHDLLAREDRVGIDAGRARYERERRIEHGVLLAREASPFGRHAHRVGQDADELARLVVHEALARGRADLDRALDEQEPRRVVGLHVDVEDGAAHGDRRCRHVDHVGRLGGEPRDEAERAAHEVHHDGAAVDVGIVDELVEQELGAGPERELGLVAQLDLAAAFIVDGDELLGAYAVALREVVFIVLERRRHDADNGDGRSDRVSGHSKCRGADKAGNEEGGKAERVSRQPHGRCTFAGAGSSMRARNRAGAGVRGRIVSLPKTTTLPGAR